jgi:4-diphosphocytidyl-2-C-methyl-D-erythritol kinase
VSLARLTEHAPAKVNVALALGPTRPDGRHELVTVIDALTLADELVLEPAPPGAGEDVVVCPGVTGDNLAARALRAFRAATGWDAPPVRIAITKRVPIAAGMGGGSSDAAAALRLARRASGLGDDELLLALAAGLGSDVPALVRPGRVLGRGAGDRVVPLAGEAYGLLVLPSAAQLSTPAVYAEADRLGLARPALPHGPPEPWVNDLEPAARSLEPSIDEALAAAGAAGAERVLVAGSGPTVVGVFATPAEAERAARALAGRHPAPIATRPLAAAAA